MKLEVMPPTCTVGTADVIGQMPSTWAADIRSVVRDHVKAASLSGDDQSSREPSGSSIPYGIVDGRTVIAELPWLDALYRGPWRRAASEFAGVDLDVARDPRGGVNLNSLNGAGSRYEMHVDTNPCTGLLFVTTHDPTDGGDLVFSQDRADLHIWPKAGTLLVFDARQVPHTVNPLLLDTHRISAPMNYFAKGDPQIRPALDDYLYSEGP